MVFTNVSSVPTHDIHRKAALHMKIATTLLVFLILFLPAYGKPPSVEPPSVEQPSTEPPSVHQHTQMNLPKGVVARLGKGSINRIQYSPDGTRLAVASTIGIWLYDTTTHREVALITSPAGGVYTVAFSPDGKVLASGSIDGTVLLWRVH